MSDPDDEPTMASYCDEHLAWLNEGWIEERIRHSALSVRFKKRIWTCQDGSTVPLNRMTDRHLLNAYRMLKCKGFIGKRTLDFYLTDPGPNGDMAQDAFRQEQDEVFSCPVSPWLDVLEDEIKRRGLQA